MQASVDEIGDGIYRLSAFMPQVFPPAGFTFNAFLVTADEPLLFHCGYRKLFPVFSAALARVIPVERLRWISFGHLEADECGAMNEWLAAAPHAEIVHGVLGARLSIDDMADRPARALADGDVLDLGGRRVRFVDTPHVPHGWDAGVIHEETTGTLFCGDLFAHVGDGPAVISGDILGPATATPALDAAMSLAPSTPATLRRLAALVPRRLAVMHGSSFEGDAKAALEALAGHYAAAIAAAA